MKNYVHSHFIIYSINFIVYYSGIQIVTLDSLDLEKVTKLLSPMSYRQDSINLTEFLHNLSEINNMRYSTGCLVLSQCALARSHCSYSRRMAWKLIT